MTNEIMNTLGFGGVDIAYFFLGMAIIIIILFILIMVQMRQTSKLKKKYAMFMLGKDAKNLESRILTLVEENKCLKDMAGENRKDIRRLYRNMEYTYQKMGLIKYDAFKQMGGQLSFSLALLNDKNNGFIINSVHSSDGCYSYTKEIKDGTSEISLGEEEKQALDIAMNSNHKTNPEK
ncbi:MAG: DUF4446 family protein [Lachnospiraceae bacterium]